MKEKGFRYKVKAYRLHDGTHEKLKKIRSELGVSWNRTFYKLIKEYEKCKKEC